MRAVTEEPPNTAERYRLFGVTEARGESACYEEWAPGVAGDPEVVALIDELPRPRRTSRPDARCCCRCLRVCRSRSR